ncbi:MAG: 5-formyltetrahydrofolate cyclo-ligase [Flavobacterium sp.]|nr:5-formyltetrahydrofolate cyclo-ligase [Flavobacterium sp.]
MNKSELRLEYKKRRAALTPEAIDEQSIAIANQLLKMSIWEHTYFHVFLPIEKQHEVNTEFILHLLAGKDKEIIVSKSDFATREMCHFLLTDSTKIVPNSYGIPEPVSGLTVPVETIEVVFVPLLAYDKSGHRVGYGKGFYDKFLKQCNPNTVKIGLSFFAPEEKIEDASTHDIPLDYVVTPDGVVGSRFR